MAREKKRESEREQPVAGQVFISVRGLAPIPAGANNGSRSLRASCEFDEK